VDWKRGGSTVDPPTRTSSRTVCWNLGGSTVDPPTRTSSRKVDVDDCGRGGSTVVRYSEAA
jgi:hypothetical protein